MSNLLHPVGPEPASVYWRRRIIAIVGILVVLMLLWWIVSPGGSQKPASAPSPEPLPTLSASPDASPSASGSSSTDCDDSDIQVTVDSDQSSFAAGSTATFVMKITNVGQGICTRDVGSAVNGFAITSGGVDVWTSDACSEPGENQVEEIPPGDSFVVKGTWDLTVNSDGCGSSATPAQAGSYQVVASNGDVSSDPFTFSVS